MSDFHVLGSGPANDDGAGCVCIGGGGSTAAGLDGGFGGAVAEGARGCGQRAGVRQAAAVRVAGGGQADRCWAADGAGADQVVPDAPSPAAAQPREVGSGSSVPPLRMPLLPSRSLGRSGLSGGWMAPWTAPPQQQQAAEGPLAAVRQQSCYMDVFDTDTAGAGSALGAQLGPRPSHKDSPLTYVTPLAIPDPALGNEEELSLRGLGAGELWKAPASDACISPVAQAGGSEGARGEPSVPRQQQQQHPQQPVLSSVRCANSVPWYLQRASLADLFGLGCRNGANETRLAMHRLPCVVQEYAEHHWKRACSFSPAPPFVCTQPPLELHHTAELAGGAGRGAPAWPPVIRRAGCPGTATAAGARAGAAAGAAATEDTAGAAPDQASRA